MKRLSSIAGILTLSALPLAVQGLQSSTNQNPTAASATIASGAPFELEVFMRDSGHLKASLSSPAAAEVRDCLQAALTSGFAPGRRPIDLTRMALRQFFPSVSEQVSFDVLYTVHWSYEERDWVIVCLERAVFSVNSEAGVVSVAVQQPMRQN